MHAGGCAAAEHGPAAGTTREELGRLPRRPPAGQRCPVPPQLRAQAAGPGGGRVMAGAEHIAVLIAGGGPAGLAAAAELSLHGVGCVVIEPRVTVSHRRPRAKTTSVRTMEHLRRWGVAEALRAAAPLPVAWLQR